MNFILDLILLDATKFFNVKLIDWEDFLKLVFRFSITFAFLIIVAKGIYYRLYQKKQYLFTYLMVGSVIFFLCFLLDNVKLELGLALGLFAIFGILRYRTDAIPIKEMSYLFIVIGIAAINGLANKKVSYIELAFTNLIITGLAFGVEQIWSHVKQDSKTIPINRMDLISPDKEEELIQYIKSETGLPIEKVKVGKINLVKKEAQIKVYYSLG